MGGNYLSKRPKMQAFYPTPKVQISEGLYKFKFSSGIGTYSLFTGID